MHTNFMKTIGLAVFISLIMPVGMLLAKESAMTTGLTSNTSRWYDVDEASNLLSRMQDLAINARKALGPIQVEEIELQWRIQATKLNRAKSSVNQMGDDLLRLEELSSKLEPWQQRLINKITPSVHEMALQLDAAIHMLNKYPMRDRLALTQYPQNINSFCKSSSQVVNTISTVRQYVHAEQKMAALNKTKGATAGS